MLKLLRLLSFSLFIIPITVVVLSMKSCSDIEGEMTHITPEQTYKCSFHDKPLVMVGWRGKVSIRRYTMKDPTRGTVIEGIRHYARECESLPLNMTSEVESQLETLKGERNTSAWWSLFFIILSGVSVYLSVHLQVWFENKGKEKDLS